LRKASFSDPRQRAPTCASRSIFPVDLSSLAQTVITQRRERMHDAGPALRGVGSAYFQFNGGMLLVGEAQVRPGKGEEMVERVIRFARERWLAISWTVLQSQDSPELRQALAHQGFVHRETLRLMGRVGGLITPAPQPAEVMVQTVTSIAMMQQYERISSWGFNHQEHLSPEYVQMRARERWDEQESRWYQYYLGFLNGNPASGAYVSLWEQVPTIYGVATIPPARRQGVAGWVLRVLVQDVLRLGFPWSCLYVAAGNPAQLLYESLGFTPLLEQTTLQWGESRW
jgi:GNAT superfamily N-acetyltransferase